MAFGWFNRFFEKRQVGPGDSGLNSYITDVGNYLSMGGDANAAQTAAVEFALSAIGKAFMSAVVKPAIPALTPLTLSMIARQTIAQGNAVYRIGVNPGTGALRLSPVSDYEISGGIAPESWVYSIEQERPTGEPLKAPVPYAGIVHVRYMPRPSAPWHGVAPLVAAGASAEVLALIERSLKYDAMPRGGLIMPQPDGTNVNTPVQLKAALTAGLGAINLVETTNQGFGQGITAAPKEDWVQKRFGAMVPPASIQLLGEEAAWILDALGVPAGLHGADGGAKREDYRHFFTATILPLKALIEAELSEKLERKITLFFPAVFESDISARSRGFSSMVKDGLDVDYAAGIVGLPLPVKMAPEPEPVAAPAPVAGATPTAWPPTP